MGILHSHSFQLLVHEPLKGTPPSAAGPQVFEEDQPVNGYFLLYSGHRVAWGLPSGNSKYTPVFLDLTVEVPQLQGWSLPAPHHRQDHRDPSQDGIDCPFLLFLTPTHSSCSGSLHRKNSPSLCGQDHWERISALSRASWSAQTSRCWTVPSEPSGSRFTAGNGKDLFSKFEPKCNQPSPVPLGIRHRHLAGEELIAHRFTMSLIGVDMSRELWPPPGCQDALDAGRPGGYLVRVRSQQALSLHVKIVNRRARSHPSTLQDGEINFSTLPPPRGGRELPWKQTFHWFWRKLLSICNNDDLLEGLGSKSDTPLKGKWFFSPHKEKKLLKHRRLLINNGA